MAAVVCLRKLILFLRYDTPMCNLNFFYFLKSISHWCFYDVQAIGVKVQNGYGLTETSPVIAARRPGCNVSNISFALKTRNLHISIYACKCAVYTLLIIKIFICHIWL